jgi:hypothetical protein
MAVHAVHKAGVLHRDLKPSNVLLADAKQVKVTDFGLAKLQSQSNSLTEPHSIVGTPSYISGAGWRRLPQCWSGCGRVFSGAILYELLSGQPPFLGASVLDTLALIRSEEPVPLRRLQPRLPRDLETICLVCLAKAPRLRYETAAALAEDLDCFLTGTPIAARRPGPLERLVRAAKRRPAIATAAVGLIVVAGVIVAASRIHETQQRQLADEALVQSIATADEQVLPQLLDRLRRDEPAVLTLIRESLAEAKPTDPRWVNLAIAELIADSDASVGNLLAYLPTARPTEISLLTNVLAGHRSDASDRMWGMLLDNQAPDDARLKVACLAAIVAPNDARWVAAAPAVARPVAQHPSTSEHSRRSCEPANR